MDKGKEKGKSRGKGREKRKGNVMCKRKRWKM